MTEGEKELFARSVVALEKLVHETARLRGDVVRLYGRIEPFEGEIEVPYAPHYYEPPKTFRDVLDAFTAVRKQIERCEGIINLTSARVNQIRDNAWSRGEMRPWLKD